MGGAKAVIPSILSWSEDRPAWQRDALRRLIIQGELNNTDKVELRDMVRQWAHLPLKDTPAEPQPLALLHFPSIRVDDSVLHLLSLNGVEGVNALDVGQTLTFGREGLTVVYGENGAGKSGYFRVLKHACQARVVEPILGNVRQAAPLRQRATLEIVGSIEEEQTRSIAWDGVSSPQELNQFSLFDNSCGRQIVGTASDPVFLPVGLEIFSPFSALLDEVSGFLEVESAKLRDNEALTLCLSEMNGDHEVGKLVASFPAKVTKEAIESLASLSEEDLEEIESTERRLKELAAADPTAAVAGLDSFKKRIIQEKERLQTFIDRFGTDAIQSLTEKKEALRVALEARSLAQALRTKGDPLPGVGSDPWRELFKAAKAYSTQQAYPNLEFPVTDPGALCVLCMQPLKEDAADRLRRFESFIHDSSEQLVSKAEVEWRKEFALLVGAQLDPINLVLLEELLRESPAIGASLVAACEELRRIHAKALESFQTGTTVYENSTLPPIISGLESFELYLDERITSLKAENPNAEAAPLRMRLFALKAQQALAKNKPILIESLRRKAIADHISTLQPDLATRTVTEKQKALATEAIAGKYGDALQRELNALKVDRFRLGYKSTASKGQALQQLHFPDAPKVGKPEQVLSEGEHRVAALAAFLAEVSLRPIASGIILDDPVSSLDHRWVQRVARRLVEEAKKRQVVVFTHHIHFLFALRSAAEEEEVKVPFHPRTIQWGRNRPGVVIEGLPWRGRGVGERICTLQKIIADARKHYEKDPTGEAFANDRSQFMNRLRATWERQVEEGLFNNVVTRFQEEVHTNQLRDVVVNDEDFQAISVGMTWASRQIDGHDHSIGVADVDLTPEDMAEALGHLQRYRTALKERQKAVQDSRR